MSQPNPLPPPPPSNTSLGGAHAHGNVGRQVADDRDNAEGVGQLGLRHTNTARHVVDDRDAEGSGRPATTGTIPQCANYWAPRTRQRRHKEHRPQRPSECGDPAQQAEGRMGDCPEARKATATRRSVTQGGGLWQQWVLPLFRDPDRLEPSLFKVCRLSVWPWSVQVQ